jgi:hypothetical protein
MTALLPLGIPQCTPHIDQNQSQNQNTLLRHGRLPAHSVLHGAKEPVDGYDNSGFPLLAGRFLTAQVRYMRAQEKAMRQSCRRTYLYQLPRQSKHLPRAQSVVRSTSEVTIPSHLEVDNLQEIRKRRNQYHHQTLEAAVRIGLWKSLRVHADS